MASVGQQLSLMCIGQDVRGNINLSLKSTLPRPERVETNDVAEESVLDTKETRNIWASVGNEYNTREEHHSAKLATGKHEATKTKPSILIHSAAECDEEKRSLNQSSKGNLRSGNGSQPGHKSKHLPFHDAVYSTPSTSSHLAQDVIDSLPSLSIPSPHEKYKKLRSSMLNETVDTAVTPKTMKLGTEVTAQVYQIRAQVLFWIWTEDSEECIGLRKMAKGTMR